MAVTLCCQLKEINKTTNYGNYKLGIRPYTQRDSI